MRGVGRSEVVIRKLVGPATAVINESGDSLVVRRNQIRRRLRITGL